MDNCVIEKIQLKKIDIYSNFYIVEFKIKALKSFDFFIDDIKCVEGKNITLVCNFSDLILLKDTRIEKNEIIKGFGVFEKNIISTLKPSFLYQNKVIKESV